MWEFRFYKAVLLTHLTHLKAGLLAHLTHFTHKLFAPCGEAFAYTRLTFLEWYVNYYSKLTLVLPQLMGPAHF